VLVRMDSAYYGRDAVHAAITGGAAVSVTVRLDPAVKAAIASIDDGAWTTIKYPNAIFDETTGTWVSKAEVAEVPYTAFTSRKKADRVTGPARRAPDPRRARRSKKQGRRAGHPVRPVALPRVLHHRPAEQLDTVAADKTHRGHAIIEQVHADLKPPRWRTCPPGGSPRTVPGSCSRSSRSTSPAPPPP
jgi:hypothetical protein